VVFIIVLVYHINKELPFYSIYSTEQFQLTLKDTKTLDIYNIPFLSKGVLKCFLSDI